ncbi:unnamed protein product [Rhizopus microsporus]
MLLNERANSLSSMVSLYTSHSSIFSFSFLCTSVSPRPRTKISIVIFWESVRLFAPTVVLFSSIFFFFNNNNNNMSAVRKVRWSEADDNKDNEEDSLQQQEDYVMDNQPSVDQPNTPANSWAFMPTTNFTAHNPYQDEEDYSEEDDQTNSEEEDDTALNQLYARNQSLSSAPPEITHERLEWQQMLQFVLMGEVLKSEKKRLSSSDKFQQPTPTQEIWLALRALLRGRTLLEEQKCLEDSRKEIEGI